MNPELPAEHDPHDQISVLHVDDEPDFADLAATFLEREDDDLTVDVETSATGALDRLGTEEFDCVVSDYDMPDLNGIELLERVREDHPDLPFVLFTGKGSEEVASDAISAGVSDYLQKDVGSEQYELLCNRIKNVVTKRRAELNYSELFEKVHVGLTIHDPETGVIIDANRSFLEFIKYERDELIGTHPGELSSAGSRFTREKANELLQRTFDEGPQTFEWRDQTKDGDPLWVEVNLKQTVIDGKTKILAIVQDITERKEHDQAIETAKRKFETIFENSNDAVLITDVESDAIINCNPAATELLGYSRDELVGMGAAELYSHNLQEFLSFTDSVLEAGNGWTDELTCSGKYDEGVPTEISSAACELDGQTCLVHSIRDISERKRRKRELETKERQFEAVFNNPVTFMGILKPDGTVRRINETALEFMDATPEEVVGSQFPELPAWRYSSDLQTDLRGWLERAAQGEFVRFEAENRAPDGELVTIDGIIQPVEDDGEVTHLVTAGRDITERKHRERELEETANHLRIVMEAVQSAVFLVDRENRTVVMSDFAKELLGSEGEVVEGDKPQEVVSEKFPSEAIDGIDRMHRRTLETETRVENEIQLPGPDGNRTVKAITVPYYTGSDEPAGVCGVAIDITEQKAREKRVAAANERLDTFASVVSHDLRNPLTVAEGQLELAREECDSDNLDAVARAHQRMDTLIDDLLTLAREGAEVGELDRVDLGALAERCWETVATADATIVTEGDPVLMADTSRLRQLLENLIRNAVEHGGNELTITVGELDDGFYVEDDGDGIPEDSIDDVFEAGYSTAERGTGFGLSIVKQVVDAHGWEIRAMNGSSDGARFEIRGVRNPTQ